jgi:hypothetical protein
MKNYTSLQLTGDSLHRAQAATSLFSDEESILTFRPPKSNGGKKAQETLFESIHMLEMETNKFTIENKSQVFGYEVKIDSEDIEFQFYSPSTEFTERLTKQLVVHYPGSQLGVPQDKFISLPENYYATATRFQLNNHYFEPLRNNGPAQSTHNSDPYETIFGELQIPEDMEVMIQCMFKPVEPGWTEILGHTLEDQAEKLLERSSTIADEFSLSGSHDRSDSKAQQAANNVKNQSGVDHAYYMDVRIAMVGPEQEYVEQEMRNLCQLYQKLFESEGGQKLVPYGVDNVNDQQHLLETMILRRPQFMRQPKTIKSWLEERRTHHYDTLIMNISDAADLAPIPSSRDFSNFNRINWSTSILDGPVPTVSEDWESPSETERSKQIKRLLDMEETEVTDTEPETGVPSAESLEEIPEEVEEDLFSEEDVDPIYETE